MMANSVSNEPSRFWPEAEQKIFAEIYSALVSSPGITCSQKTRELSANIPKILPNFPPSRPTSLNRNITRAYDPLADVSSSSSPSCAPARSIGNKNQNLDNVSPTFNPTNKSYCEQQPYLTTYSRSPCPLPQPASPEPHIASRISPIKQQFRRRNMPKLSLKPFKRSAPVVKVRPVPWATVKAEPETEPIPKVDNPPKSMSLMEQYLRKQRSDDVGQGMAGPGSESQSEGKSREIRCQSNDVRQSGRHGYEDLTTSKTPKTSKFEFNFGRRSPDPVPQSQIPDSPERSLSSLSSFSPPNSPEIPLTQKRVPGCNMSEPHINTAAEALAHAVSQNVIQCGRPIPAEPSVSVTQALEDGLSSQSEPISPQSAFSWLEAFPKSKLEFDFSSDMNDLASQSTVDDFGTAQPDIETNKFTSITKTGVPRSERELVYPPTLKSSTLPSRSPSPLLLVPAKPLNPLAANPTNLKGFQSDDSSSCGMTSSKKRLRGSDSTAFLCPKCHEGFSKRKNVLRHLVDFHGVSESNAAMDAPRRKSIRKEDLLSADSPENEISKDESTQPCQVCHKECAASCMFCSNCGNQFSKRQKTETIVPPKKFCSKCGVAVRDTSNYCSGCGTSVSGDQVHSLNTSKAVPPNVIHGIPASQPVRTMSNEQSTNTYNVSRILSQQDSVKTFPTASVSDRALVDAWSAGRRVGLWQCDTCARVLHEFDRAQHGQHCQKAENNTPMEVSASQMDLSANHSKLNQTVSANVDKTSYKYLFEKLQNMNDLSLAKISASFTVLDFQTILSANHCDFVKGRKKQHLAEKVFNLVNCQNLAPPKEKQEQKTAGDLSGFGDAIAKQQRIRSRQTGDFQPLVQLLSDAVTDGSMAPELSSMFDVTIP
eukprot:495011_1